MTAATLEHVNLSVSNPDRSARLFIKLFDWHIRWEGPSINGGHTIHVGSEGDYLALYSHESVQGGFSKGQPMNHIGFVVDNLETAEEIVIEAGLKPYGHEKYEPGRRFYFFDWDGIEFEIVSYE